ncbi:MBL fold metallo-hydrolase [Zavarzinia compransoris]|uniref:MBL fold metallo-hydrolase n=1 Tax=Zavarzinia marina TaxID=2911065 RepID=UPI001F3B014E|nr:MBL fold metallo-hydrolase [Zavarzinia marina]MCF4166248.1 MBL fold metallo-hydrolase [Zavarzinia marina]
MARGVYVGRTFRVVMSLVVGLAVLAAAVWLVAGDRVVLALAGRMAAQNMAADRAAELPDGLHLAVCGAGGPMPDPLRSGPCQLVIAGRSVFMVDAGSMGARNMVRMGIRPGGLTAILLTHFHSDHIDGLGEAMMLRWTGGPAKVPVPVYGPPGVERVVEGFDAAYALDAQYRTAHHGPDVVPPGGAGGIAHAFVMPGPGEGTTVYEADGVKVTAFAVDHAPAAPAVGYRFDYGGRSLVLSGDTAPSANLEAFAEGADLLVHEALSPRLVAMLGEAAGAAGRGNLVHVMEDIPGYHTAPTDAAAIAARAGVRRLVFVHVTPPLPNALLHGVFLDGVADIFDGPVDIARDGLLLSLPAGSDEILSRHLL